MTRIAITGPFSSVFCNAFPLSHPGNKPSTIGRKIINGIRYQEKEPPETIFVTKALTEKKTIMPTISSSTAIGSKVSVTGPLQWKSCTMERAGAGAVARAIEPKTKAR